MSNELQTTNTNIVSILDDQINDEQPSTIAEVGSQEWIPLLAICYALSETFKKGIAKPGEFTLGNTTSLGNTIEAVCIDYRVHTIMVDKAKQTFEGHVFVSSDWKKPLAEHEEYQKFMNQSVPPNCEIQEGTDLFFYIPSANTFASILCKKTLATSANEVFKAGKGGRLLEISTVEQQNKARSRSWYIMRPIQTKRALVGSKLPDVTADVAFQADAFAKYYTLFKNPEKGAVKDETAPTRER